MSVSRIVIAIDGPAASGKSSTAQSVADRLHIRHVDSGSLYRALTMVALEASPDAAAWAEADVLGQSSRVTLVPADSRSFAPLVDGQPVGDRVRSAEVTGHVSLVASMGRVRAWVNEQIRAAARAHDVVVDGRDIGTAVFPQAMLKVFLVADPQERARRRLMQRLNRGPTDAEVAEETDRLVYLRKERQRRFTTGSLRLWAIIDEMALRRPVGNPGLMRTQLDYLLEISERPGLTLQMTPYPAGASYLVPGSFSMLSFATADLPDVVYVEQLTSAMYLDKRSDLDRYTAAFDKVSATSATPERTREFIRELVDDMEEFA